ncbi:SGNH/GDSL hydrolase family protein [Actinomadura keratinilytica]|uniref:SGNH hydrolase-type esterase domain-containing protein n=1 Tax=Actinomadura keratinilytica TaxID=547461 RepID=A0ABP7Y3P4_9ACTN
MSRRVRSALVVLLALGLAGAAAVYLRSDSTSARNTAPRPRPPVVYVLGDSFTTGIRGLTKEQAYAGQAARMLGWQAVIGGRVGSGFAEPGPAKQRFDTLFTRQFAWRPAPDMMLVSGGHNDVLTPMGQVRRRTVALIRRIRAHWPGTHLVIMGPTWGRDVGAKAIRVRNTIRAAAVSERVPFIDPIGQRWFTGNRRKGTGNAVHYIRADNIHPNPAGNRHMAACLVANLRTLGLARPVRGRPATPSPAATPPPVTAPTAAATP